METNFLTCLLVSLVILGAVTEVCNGGRIKEETHGGKAKGGNNGHGAGKGANHGNGKRNKREIEGLSMNFYQQTCNKVEDIVKDITWSHVAANPTMAARLLRLHYHDCFVRGCDASILLDSTDKNTPAEKEARPNLSVSGYEVIDEIKARIESICPGTVSCADILALAARDAVSFQFRRPMWKVLTGRRDGSVSLASEVTPNTLPSASANFTTLQLIFSNKGLDVTDLVALSGAHSIGVARCGVITRRLFNFTGKGDTDPSLDPTYAKFLKTQCTNSGSIVEMDPQSSGSFDSHYFQILNQKKGLFASDASLLTNPLSAIIAKMLEQPSAFLNQFGNSMINMGAVEVLTGRAGEIRKQCHVVNS